MSKQNHLVGKRFTMILLHGLQWAQCASKTFELNVNCDQAVLPPPDHK